MAKNFINKVNYPATEKEVVNGFLASGHSLREYSYYSGIPKSTLWDMVQRSGKLAASKATTPPPVPVKTVKTVKAAKLAKVPNLKIDTRPFEKALDKFDNAAMELGDLAYSVRCAYDDLICDIEDFKADIDDFNNTFKS